MLVIKDFATTILASALTAAATSVVVSDASRLPALSAGDYYYLVLQKFTDRTSVEVVKVTGAAGNTLTVVRAQAGTTAKSFAIGDYAEQRITVATFSEYIAQAAVGKVDKSGGYAEQSFGLLNTGDLVKAAVGISYDATNGHGTILSGGEGANKVTPYVALRPLGVADSSVQLKYAQDGSLILSGGSRYVETGLLSMKHPADANGWPNAINSDANNYNNRARGKVHVNNNALYFIADAALNARRFGIQSGHEDPGYATSYGVLDLNPFGGNVRVNGGLVYHTNYVPTPAAVGALALSGGIITGSLDQNIAGYGGRMTASAGIAYLQGGKVGGDTTDQKLRITGINSVPLTEFDILTAGHGVAKANGARIYTEQYVPTPDVLGVVPQARTINSKPLTSNITLSAADVGALPLIGGTVTGQLNLYGANKQIAFVNQQNYIAMSGDAMYIAANGPTGFIALEGVDNPKVRLNKLSGREDHTIYHTGFKPSPEDAQAFRSVGVTATVNATPGVAWNARSGVYTSINAGDSDLVAHFFGNSSCPALQIKARYRNGGLWYRSARDYFGFEESWAAIYTTKNKPTAADVGAVPATGGTVSGALGVTAELVLVGGSASDMAAIAWIAPDGTERGRLWIGGTVGADNSLTWRSGASGATHKIYHEGNKPTAADVGAVKQGDRFVANNAVGNDYYQCAIEVNGNTAIDSCPGIGFHMAGRFASTLHLWEGGDFRFHTQGLASYAGIITGNVNANDVYIRSDRRLKKNLVEVRDALRKVSSLTAYSYDKRQTLEATEYDKKEVGLIAQDVEQVLPEAVTRVVDSSNKDGIEILTLSNSALIALLVGAVKELSEKVKELEHGRP